MKSRSIIVHTVFLFTFLFGSSSLMAQSALKAAENQQKNLELQMEMAENHMRAMENQGRVVENIRGLTSFSQSEDRSSLILSKSYDGETVSKSGKFNVERGTEEISLSIDGKVRSGMIVLTIKTPSGEVIKELIIDDTADIMWSQTINNKLRNEKYFGEWSYKITTDKAKGGYRLSIRTK